MSHWFHRHKENRSFGERAADRLAAFGGSWKFLGIFSGVMVVWMGVNSVYALLKPFDPYPFILLNLALSCLAAIQAPIIMMSQNRQADRDRHQAEADYKINIEAEKRIEKLQKHVAKIEIEKLDKILDAVHKSKS